MSDTAAPLMWYEQLPSDKSWATLWSGYTICGKCQGIRRFQGPCHVCGDPPFRLESQLFQDESGREYRIPMAFAGAEGRYEDWVYLRMMEREWKRPVLDEDRFPGLPTSAGPSPRASIVILFWSYFETRIERVFRAGLREVPKRILDDMLRRYSAIGTQRVVEKLKEEHEAWIAVFNKRATKQA